MGSSSQIHNQNPQTEGPDLLLAEVLSYRKLLLREVDAHRTFSRFTILTGFALMVGGLTLAYYYSALGWLLAILGLLRSLNSLYDLKREDELHKGLKLIEEKFGAH